MKSDMQKPWVSEKLRISVSFSDAYSETVLMILLLIEDQSYLASEAILTSDSYWSFFLYQFHHFEKLGKIFVPTKYNMN